MIRLLWMVALGACIACIGCGRRPTSAAPVAAPPPAVTAVAPTAAVAPALPAENAQPPADLEAGVTAVEALQDAGDFVAAGRQLAALRAAFPADADRLDAMAAGLRALRREATELDYALQQLAGTDSAAMRVAGAQLIDAGDVGRILLRRTVRQGSDPAAAHAAALLASSGDAKAAAEILARFLAKSDDAMSGALLKSLASLGKSVPPAVLAPLLPLITGDPQHARRDVADVLLVPALSRGPARAAEFDAALGVTNAFAALQGYVESALTNHNAVLSAWAGKSAAGLGILQPGIRGYYYEGEAFEKLVRERIEPQIQFADRTMPYPDGRQDGISVRWQGKLVVTQPGSYGFRIASDDGNRMWLDSVKLFDHWGSPAEHRATVDLKPGLHELVIEFQQGVGGSYINVNWTPPGSQEQPLTKANLLAAP